MLASFRRNIGGCICLVSKGNHKVMPHVYTYSCTWWHIFNCQHQITQPVSADKPAWNCDLHSVGAPKRKIGIICWVSLVLLLFLVSVIPVVRNPAEACSPRSLSEGPGARLEAA